jgi:hypothetical protein
VDEDRDTRAAYLAAYVPLDFSAGRDGRMGLGTAYLVRYGDRKDVRNAISANFHTGAWSGPRSAHLSGQIIEMEKLLSEAVHANVKKWAREEMESLTEERRAELIREERGL